MMEKPEYVCNLKTLSLQEQLSLRVKNDNL